MNRLSSWSFTRILPLGNRPFGLFFGPLRIHPAFFCLFRFLRSIFLRPKNFSFDSGFPLRFCFGRNRRPAFRSPLRFGNFGSPGPVFGTLGFKLIQPSQGVVLLSSKLISSLISITNHRFQRKNHFGFVGSGQKSN